MPDDRYIPYQRNPRGPRNPKDRTPIEELDYHYKNKMGVFQTRPSSTPLDTAVQPPARGLSSDYIQKQGVANPNLMPKGGDIWGRIREELRNLKGGAWTLERINRGPQDVAPGSALSGPFVRRPPIATPDVAASHAPVVPTTEKGAPASTYDRGEGAPSGTTRRQEQITAGAPPGDIRQQSTGNKYLDMYYASAAAQKKYLGGLPEGQAPIEIIRGPSIPPPFTSKIPFPLMPKRRYEPIQQTFYSPTTGKEYNTKLEAAFGVQHEPEMARLIGKEKAEAGKQRFQAVKVDDPNNFGAETIKIVDTHTGQVVPDSKIDPDLQAAQASYPTFMKMTPEEQDKELANMTAQQRQALIQIIRQLAQEQGGK